jgi:quercetin dioxygenase-like cupin family protein
MNRVILRAVTAPAIFCAAIVMFAKGSGHAPHLAGKVSHATAFSQPLILQESEGERLIHRGGPMGHLPLIIKVDEENGGAEDFVVFTERLAPGKTIPFHKHSNAEEILFLDDAGATVTVGDKRAVAGARTIVFIPRDTWISASNTGTQDVHLVSIFSRQGFEQYLRAVSVKEGQTVNPISVDELQQARALGHATYWDAAKGPYPPGVAHP